MTRERLDTAYEEWDRRWADPGLRRDWREPDPEVTGFIPALLARGARRVVDVGTGIGRHALAYARSGLDVVAVDASTSGVAELARAADAEGLSVTTHVAPFTALPVDDASVDHVLAWNVLYHGDASTVAAALAECRRTLRAGGTLQLTMLSKRHRAYGHGVEIRPDTFVDEASDDDKRHPHHYLDAVGLARLLADAGFAPVSLVDLDQEPPTRAFHWTVLAETT